MHSPVIAPPTPPIATGSGSVMSLAQLRAERLKAKQEEEEEALKQARMAVFAERQLLKTKAPRI